MTVAQPTVSQPAPVTSAVKKVKLDTRAATLSFLGLASAAEQAPAISEFDRYIATPVPADVDALQWWHDNEKHFPTVACLAKKYLSMPATSVLSERQFSAAGRLVTKLRSRLDPDRVDTIMFLYKSM